MISDDIKDDDILDDDFDIDEFEDDWDDTQDIDAPNDAPAVEKPKGSPSFLQKFFLPIVIGVVVIFGLIFIVGQGLLSSSPDSNDATNANLIPADDNIALEDDIANNATFAVEPEPVAAPPEQDAPLTPLPGEVSDTEQLELTDLDTELFDSGDDETFIAETELVDTPPSNAADDLFGDTTDFSMRDNDPVEQVEAEPLPLNNDASLVEGEQVLENIDPIAESDNTNDDIADILSADVTSEPTPLDVSGNNSDMQMLEDEKTALEQSNQELQKSLENSRNTIEALNDEIASLKNELMQAKEVDKTPPKPTASPQVEQPAKTTVQDNVSAAPKPSKPAEPMPKWTLKSAQPGAATIAPKGSSDLKNIEVGNVIAGLGRIKSIELENGKWVVKGTQGTVSQ